MNTINLFPSLIRLMSNPRSSKMCIKTWITTHYFIWSFSGTRWPLFSTMWLS